jgi:CheY-like chemotaxis protein
MDGREVLARIKKDESLRMIPTVILTASDAKEDLVYCYNNHANCYIRKPDEWDTFDSVVRRINEFWLFMVRLP